MSPRPLQLMKESSNIIKITTKLREEAPANNLTNTTKNYHKSNSMEKKAVETTIRNHTIKIKGRESRPTKNRVATNREEELIIGEMAMRSRGREKSTTLL
jgi:hypothetical protein